ncbi:MAG: hypothetical protein WBG08_01480 [Litorimonas sp.]
MTDSDEIIVLSPDEPEEDAYDVEDIEAEDEPPRPKRPLWPFLLLGGFLSGIALTLAAQWMMRPDVPEPFDPTPLEARIDALQSELASVRNRPAPRIPRVDLSPLERRLDALEARPQVEDVIGGDVVDRLEALQREGFVIPDLTEFPDTDAMEARLSALEGRVEEVGAVAESASLAALDRPAPVIVAPDAAVPEPDIDMSRLPRFPAQALRNGAAELAGSGLLRRTLSRHVRVRGEDSPDRLIDAIEADLSEGRPRAALTKFDRLPDRLKTLARGWRADMDSALAQAGAPAEPQPED